MCFKCYIKVNNYAEAFWSLGSTCFPGIKCQHVRSKMRWQNEIPIRTQVGSHTHHTFPCQTLDYSYPFFTPFNHSCHSFGFCPASTFSIVVYEWEVVSIFSSYDLAPRCTTKKHVPWEASMHPGNMRSLSTANEQCMTEKWCVQKGISTKKISFYF